MYSETPDVIPFYSPYTIEVLTQSQLETLKNGTLTLLDEVVSIFHPKRHSRSSLTMVPG